MPRYRRSYQAQLIGVVILLALAIARWQHWVTDGFNEKPSAAPGGLPSGIYAVDRVIDGDTLVLRGHGRLRLQGIDCPEIEHDDKPGEPLGPEATTLAQVFVRDAGSKIRIEADGEPQDHFGRWLGFVYDGKRQLNEQLVRAGLARAMLRYDYSQAMKDRLRAAQLDAQRAGRGLWAAH